MVPALATPVPLSDTCTLDMRIVEPAFTLKPVPLFEARQLSRFNSEAASGPSEKNPASALPEATQFFMDTRLPFEADIPARTFPSNLTLSSVACMVVPPDEGRTTTPLAPLFLMIESTTTSLPPVVRSSLI